jgi:hypothetical protein
VADQKTIEQIIEEQMPGYRVVPPSEIPRTSVPPDATSPDLETLRRHYDAVRRRHGPGPKAVVVEGGKVIGREG